MLVAVLWLTPAAALPFSDDELIDGFVATVFGAEDATTNRQNGSSQLLVKKFVGPITYTIINRASVNRVETLRRFMQSLSNTVQNLTLEETDDRDAAQMSIFLTDRQNYREIIRSTVWDGVDTEFLTQNACSAVIAARPSGIQRANIYLPADGSFEALSHCMVEEIAQSLGPANDSSTLEDSIFNDNSELNVFGVFDWYIVNMLYDERIQPGMTEREARPILPEIIADLRRRLPDVLSDNSAFARHARAGRDAPVTEP